MKINELLVKYKKFKSEYDDKIIEHNFLVAMGKIQSIFVNMNENFQKQAEEIVAELKGNWDFVLIQRAFIRFSEAVSKLYANPFDKDNINCINYLIYQFTEETAERFLCDTISLEEKNQFLNDLKKFEEYKNFLYAFTKHFECYLRFYYENLRKKNYFCFELLETYYKYENITSLNKDLVKLCDKKCKSLKKYMKK